MHASLRQRGTPDLRGGEWARTRVRSRGFGLFRYPGALPASPQVRFGEDLGPARGFTIEADGQTEADGHAEELDRLEADEAEADEAEADEAGGDHAGVVVPAHRPEH